MTDDELIRYLNGPYTQGNFEFKSAYIAALTEARSITGRDLNSGVIIDSNSTGTWAGALVYMALIDHIGGIFKNNLCTEKIEFNDFTSALENFTDLNNKEIFALYALRCSFAHDFFLFNEPKENNKNKDLLRHSFNVTKGSGKVVTLPIREWSGKLEELNSDVTTIVNLEELGNLVEGIHKTLLNLIEQNNIELKISDARISINHVGYYI